MNGVLGNLLPGMFGRNQAPAAPAAITTPANPANPAAPVNQTPANTANPANPADPAAINPATGVTNDPFADVANPFAKPAVDPNAPKPVTAGQIVSFDPAAVQQAVSKMDFLGQIPEAVQQQFASGDPAQVQQAIATMTNQVGRTVYMQMANAMQNLLNQSFGKYDQLVKSDLPGIIKQNSVTAGLYDSHPLLSDPKVQPIAQFLTQQYQAANPGHTASQIQQMVVSYLKSLGTTVGASPAESAPNDPFSQQAPAQVDWGNWVSR